MSRRGRVQSGSGVQMFPFLDALICTMGALLVLLHAFAKHGQVEAVKKAESQAVAADGSVDVQADREELEWRIGQLKEVRAKTAAQLADERLKLSHVEDHQRRLREKFEQLRIAAAELERSHSASGQQRQQALDQLAATADQVRKAQQDVADARRLAQQQAATYSVVPYEGPNSTRRRPVYIECRADSVVLQPEGIELPPDCFAGYLGPGNPLASALRGMSEYLARQTADPKQAGEPYPLLLVRPEGIGAYYAARAALDSWGAEFGYELVGSDWKLKFPEPDPRLAELTRRVVADARARQREYIQSSPQLAKSRPRSTFHASSHGGFTAERGSGGGGGRGGTDGAGPGGWDSLGTNWARGSGGGTGGTGSAVGGGGNADTSGGGTDGSGLAGAAGGSPSLFPGGPSGSGPRGTNSGGAAGGGWGGGDGSNGRGGTNGSGLAGTPGGSQGGDSGDASGPKGTGTPGQAGGASSGSRSDQLAGNSRYGQPGEQGNGQGDAASAGSQGPPGKGSPAGNQSAASGQTSSSGSGSSSSQSSSAGQGSSSGSGASSGSASSGGGGSSTSGSMGAPAPSFDASSPAPKTHSMAKSRGRDWGLPDASAAAAAATRPILVECHNDRLVIVPESSNQLPKQVSLGPKAQESMDEFVSDVWQHMKSWGIAGKGLYWRPTLLMEVKPGAADRYAEVKALLADSGLDVHERQPHATANLPAKKSNRK